MSLFDTLGAIGAGLNGISGVANSILGISNYNYQKEMQEKAWNREDTAVQRRAADLSAAGLSKTLAAGSAASTMSPISLSAPKIDFKIDEALQNLQMAKNFAQADADINLAKAQSRALNIESDQKEYDYQKIRDAGLLKNAPGGVAGLLAQGLTLAGHWLPTFGHLFSSFHFNPGNGNHGSGNPGSGNPGNGNPGSGNTDVPGMPNVSAGTGRVGSGYGGGGGGTWGFTGVGKAQYYGQTIRPNNSWDKARQRANEELQSYYFNQGKNGSFGNKYR